MRGEYRFVMAKVSKKILNCREGMRTFAISERWEDQANTYFLKGNTNNISYGNDI